MKARPMLGDWAIPRVAAVRSGERRRFAEFPIPGGRGSLFQDLDGGPIRLEILGSLHGDEDREQFLGEVQGKFQAGEPLTFVADIVHDTELQYVVIDTLELTESGERPDELHYRLTLRESPPPPPPPDPLGGLDSGLLDQAGGFLDSVTGALDAIQALGDIPELHDPTPPLRGALDGVRGALDGLGGVGTDLTDLFGGGT